MTLTKTLNIEINLNDIIEDYHLNHNACMYDIAYAVHQYLESRNQIVRFLLNDLDEERIIKAVKKQCEKE